MAKGTSIRDLFVSIGFDIESEDLDKLDRSLSGTINTAKKLAWAIGGVGVALGYVLKTAGGFEQQEVAFEVMLGGAELAKKTLDDLFQFAVVTPFKIPDLLTNSKQLLAMGFEAKNLIPTMRMLGNVASGLSVPLRQIAHNFGQVKTQGKLTGRELKDFTVAGVDLLAVLTKQLGTAGVEATRSMMQRGQISFEMVNKAFKAMTSLGGKFFKLMDRQSKTFLGIVNNITDALYILTIQAGGKLLPAAKKLANEALQFLIVNRELIKSKAADFFTKLAKIFFRLWRITKNIVAGIDGLVQAFGGWERVINGVITALVVLLGLQVLSFIGTMTAGIYKVIKALTLLKAGLFAVQFAALLVPVLIGAAVVALGLLFDDIVGYLTGKDSLTGLIIENFEKKFPKAFKTSLSVLESFKSAFKWIVEGLSLWVDGINKTIKAYKEISKLMEESGNADKKPGIFENIKTLIFDKDELAALSGFLGSTGIRSPSVAPNSSNTTNISSGPITVNVPEGTSTEQIGPIVQKSIESAMEAVWRSTHIATKPQEAF